MVEVLADTLPGAPSVHRVCIQGHCYSDRRQRPAHGDLEGHHRRAFNSPHTPCLLPKSAANQILTWCAQSSMRQPEGNFTLVMANDIFGHLTNSRCYIQCNFQNIEILNTLDLLTISLRLKLKKGAHKIINQRCSGNPDSPTGTRQPIGDVTTSCN